MRFIIFISLPIIFVSCITNQNQNICESFDFKKIPYDSSYYFENLKYSNGFDSVSLFLKSKNYTKESTLNAISLPDCNPFFELDYSNKNKEINILYSFNYFDMDEEDTSTYLNIHINSSRIELNLDTITSKLNEEFIITKIEHLNFSDLSQMVRKIKFRNMRITEIETCTGRLWRLID